MLFVLLGNTLAIIFRDSRSGLFLASKNNGVTVVPYPAEAADINLLETNPESLAVVLSVGTVAFHIEKGASKLDFENVNINDRRQFFKLILRPEGSFIFQHNDKCLGYSKFFPDRENGRNLPEVAMVDCNDMHNVVTFFKSERIDGEVRKRKILTYMDTMIGHPVPIGVEKGVEIEKFQNDVIKPEETGFLRGLYNRATHLF